MVPCNVISQRDKLFRGPSFFLYFRAPGPAPWTINDEAPIRLRGDYLLTLKPLERKVSHNVFALTEADQIGGRASFLKLKRVISQAGDGSSADGDEGLRILLPQEPEQEYRGKRLGPEGRRDAKNPILLDLFG
jgi:hypothetical protein